MAKKEVVTYKPIIYLTTDNNAQNHQDISNINLQKLNSNQKDISTETLSFKQYFLIELSKRFSRMDKLASKEEFLSFLILSRFFIPLGLSVTEIIGSVFPSLELDNTITKKNDSEVFPNDSTNSKLLLEKSVQVLPYSFVPKTLIFPPSHPIPNKFYRQHPLADKKNYYIPAELYYSILLEEKESELIKILCDLGATKIEIYEEENKLSDIKIEAQAKINSIGGMEADISKETGKNQLNIRKFTYIGKPWNPKLKSEFNSLKYSWLHYEPTWESIVHGRLTNGQLTANIELETNFSKEGMIGISLFDGLLKELAGFDASALDSNLIATKRIFSIEFAGLEESKPVNPETK